MCVFSKPKTPAPPVLPPEPAKAKLPDQGAIEPGVRRRTEDARRNAQPTVLTGQGGLTDDAAVGKKKLGQ